MSRSAAIGGTRDARTRRGDAGDERDEHADARTTRSTVLAPHRERGGRHAHPGRVHQREQAGRETDADRETERGRDEPDRRALRAAIERSTCARDAPIARSSADSRVRCAIRIENVL